MIKKPLGVCAALLTLFACAGCTHVVEQTAGDRVNDALPRYLGPADHYETQISAASTGALMRGRLRSITVIGTNVQLRPGLKVDSLQLNAQAIEVDRKKGSLKSVGSAQFVCKIGGDNLSRYVLSIRSSIKDLAVGIDGDKLTVRAKPEAFGLIGIPLMVRGDLTPEAGGTLIDFNPDRASVSIIKIPGFVLDLLAKRLNPVVDLSQLPVPIHIDSAVFADNSLTLTGSIEPDDILRAADPPQQ